MAQYTRPMPSTPLPHLRTDRSRSVSSSSSPEPPADDDGDFFTSQKNDSVSSILASLDRDRDASLPPVTVHSKNPIDRLPPEILICIFSKLNLPSDLRSCLSVSKTWARNCVDLLWHRPLCNTYENLENVALSVQNPAAYFPYVDLVKRLNLSSLSHKVNDGTLQPFEYCKRIERLTLTGCSQLTDQGIMTIVHGNRNLLALDITGLVAITDLAIRTLALNCPKLQGLNITGCRQVTDESLVMLATSCKYLKRLKLNKCYHVSDDAIVAFANNCLSMLEIDLQDCKEITDASVTALLSNGRGLRELRLTQCNRITDQAFLQLPDHLTFESLRILDLTACQEVHDCSVEKIIASAPRLRILVLAKCTEITDRSVIAITKLGKNLHDIHLGRCNQITDEALLDLVKYCNRIRYIDLAGCHRVTDKSVRRLASLPKLRRIGLVKCHSITDISIHALATGDARGRIIPPVQPSNLERVHLSYCLNITVEGIKDLLNNCPRLTHLSLTGIAEFYGRRDLISFCREAPPEFNEEQRTVFCVFSGEGVIRLRNYLNSVSEMMSNRPRDHTMYDYGEEDDGATEDMVGLMDATQIHGDGDDDMDFEVDGTVD